MNKQGFETKDLIFIARGILIVMIIDLIIKVGVIYLGGC